MWILATRNRIKNCHRFIEAWNKTGANSEVYVRLDEDDPSLDQAKSLPWPANFNVNIGPRARMGQAMQEMFTQHPNEPWYGILADDIIPRTNNWDKLLIEAAGTHSISCANEVHEKKNKNLSSLRGRRSGTTGWVFCYSNC